MSKQFILMVNEESMAAFKAAMPSLEFLAVEGMNMAANPNHLLLVSPIPLSVSQGVEEVKEEVSENV